MNWYKKASQEIKEINMFSKEFQEEHEKDMQKVYQAVIDEQDKLAQKSDIFKKILLSEREGSTPKEWYESTNNPKAKTRNAMLIRHIYKTTQEWEQDLTHNPFYKI